MTALRYASKGNSDPYRQGYQRKQRVAGPIQPMERASLLRRVLSQKYS